MRPEIAKVEQPRSKHLARMALAVATALALIPVTAAPSQAQGATFVVNSTDDPGDGTCDATECTLRDAILAANDSLSPDPFQDEIHFDIPDTAPHTIELMSALPPITQPVIIDGTTEPDFVDSPVIELDGTNAGMDVDGLHITAGDSTVRGLVINRFDRNGIQVDTAGGNAIEGNFIGTNAAGTEGLPNGLRGVSIEAPNNTVGGDTDAHRNVISGNDANGVFITFDTATGNVVQGNHIGTNAAGDERLPNNGDGVLIGNGASDNVIGGAGPGEGNVISGNGVVINGNDANGVRIFDGESSGNVVLGNRIGTNFDDATNLENTGSGVLIEDGASNNTVGGTATGAGNVISGNGINGVLIQGSASSDNVVEANLIGTNAAGAANVGNERDGVRVEDAPLNTIGGTDPDAGNVISGNEQGGVLIIGEDAQENEVLGNFVGTNPAGDAALPNEDGDGVSIWNADLNIIGAPGAGNVISGNNLDGVRIGGLASENVVEGNSIGISVAGDAVVSNGGDGVHISAATDNTIGGTGPGAGNVISGNGFNGVTIGGSIVGDPDFENEVLGNFIGTNAAGDDLGNTEDGVQINAPGNTVGGIDEEASNTIAFNGRDGVRVTGGTAVGNSILGNSIFDNVGLGIDLGGDGVTGNDPLDADTGPNNLQNFPELDAATAGSTTVQGTLHSSQNNEFRVEFFASPDCDLSGHGEGRDFLGFAVVETDGDGDVSFSETLAPTTPVGHVVTATATRLDNGTPTDTSEFSACVEVAEAPTPPPPPPPPQPARNIALTPQTDTNDTGSEHEITATVTDAEGGPVAGAAVAWELTGVGTVVSQEETTDAQGRGRIVITSAEEGTSEVTGSLDPATTDCNRAAGDPPGAPAGNCTDTASKAWEEEPDVIAVARSVGLGPRLLRNRGVAQGLLRQDEIVSVQGDPEAAERFPVRWGCLRRERMRVQRFNFRLGRWVTLRRPFTNINGFYRAPRRILTRAGDPRPGRYRTVAPFTQFTGPDDVIVRCLRAVSPVRRVPRN